MIIGIDGADNLGKTTLALELSARLGAPVYKPAATPLRGQAVSESQAEDRGAWGTAVLHAASSDVIFDRTFAAEVAYGQVFDRAWDMDQVWELEDAVSLVPHLFILLHGDWDIAHARATDDEVMQRDVWEAINRAHIDFFHRDRVRYASFHANRTIGELVEASMWRIRELRELSSPKEDVWLEVARQVSRRSTCLSRRVGAVLVSPDGHVISTGYNGAPAGFAHQNECCRLRRGDASGTALDDCIDVHAEENCVVQAATSGRITSGSTMYCTLTPCSRCMRMLVNAGVHRIVASREYPDEAAKKMAEEARIVWEVR